MDNDSPANQFVMPVDMPQCIGPCYVVLALDFDPAIPQHLAQSINSSKRVNHPEVLDTDPVIPQKPDDVTNSRFRPSPLKFCNKGIEIVITNITVLAFNSMAMHEKVESISVNTQ